VKEPGLSTGLAVVCRVGSLACAVPAEHVSETMRPLPVEPLAGMPSFVLGVCVVRGEPIPVIDAARMLGSADARPASRFVTIRIGARRAALAVHAVLGVRALATDSLRALPPLLRDVTADAVTAIGTLDADLLLVLGSARIVPASVWATLEAAGAPS
jgi:purine-binding chemotaxis protein CheW